MVENKIYAEGQRRYVESLSAYARQFLEMMDKPDVDSIEGLSPAISIQQKTTSKNPCYLQELEFHTVLIVGVKFQLNQLREFVILYSKIFQVKKS
jgi:hypothetical protein